MFELTRQSKLSFDKAAVWLEISNRLRSVGGCSGSPEDCAGRSKSEVLVLAEDLQADLCCALCWRLYRNSVSA